ESLNIFRRRVELGATSRLELTQVDLLWRQASALVAQLEQARATQAHALALLVGAPIDLPPAGDRLDGAAMFRAVEPGIPSDLLLQRPDIVAAEHALKAANANIGAARAAFFPRIALTGSLGTASAALDGLFKSGSSAWTFAPSISLPIFDGGRRQASLDLATVRRDQAITAYEQVVQSAFRDVSDALSARRWLDEQTEILRATLQVQSERARLAKLRYDSGAARYLEVLDAERELLAAEQQLVQIERARLAVQVTLYAALGGGSLAVDTTSAAGTP
ncbi:MAG: efflux transporter outer membrane subunit, partial [Burkholderiales bacterium]|nr:efflux transporter outer membrane subunit [Burkholderiales bacterium]